MRALLALVALLSVTAASAGYITLPVSGGGGGGSGTVTSVSVASANGFAGTVANATSTPAITLSTSITGILKGNGTAVSAATSGTDYAPGTSALATGILKSTTTTGGLSIATAGDFPTLNQDTTGNAGSATALKPSIQSKSSAFTAAEGLTYLVSGSNYAITLPDATTTTKEIAFIVTGSPVGGSGAITFTFQSSQTLAGFSSYALYTKYERLVIFSDGSNWQIRVHDTQTGWLTDLTHTPNSTCFGTISGASYKYRRIGGTDIEVIGEFTAGTTGAAVPSVALASTIAIDTAAFSASTMLLGFAQSKTTSQVAITGSQNLMKPYYNGSAGGTVYFAYYTNANDFTSINGNGGSGIVNAKPYFFRFIVPVSGWRP